MISKNGNKIYKFLIKLKRRGLISKIGVSAYSPNEIRKVISKYKIDVVQLPYNVFDQRLNNKLFLGNSGVNFISIFISLLIIKSYNTQNINLYCDEIFLLFYIPGLDAARVTITRALNKTSPFSPDKTFPPVTDPP